MARVLEIAEMGRDVLREVASPVSLPADANLRRLAADMMRTMRKADGVGIAAPQVFRGERVMIVAPRPNRRYPGAPDFPPIVAFNPRLTFRSAKTERGWEGCLSVPGLRGIVPRHRSIRAAWRDADGGKREMKLEGFAARVFQHELDHLDGVLFVDRVESPRDLFTEREYERASAGA